MRASVRQSWALDPPNIIIGEDRASTLHPSTKIFVSSREEARALFRPSLEYRRDLSIAIIEAARESRSLIEYLESINGLIDRESPWAFNTQHATKIFEQLSIFKPISFRDLDQAKVFLNNLSCVFEDQLLTQDVLKPLQSGFKIFNKGLYSSEGILISIGLKKFLKTLIASFPSRLSPAVFIDFLEALSVIPRTVIPLKHLKKLVYDLLPIDQFWTANQVARLLTSLSAIGTQVVSVELFTKISNVISRVRTFDQGNLAVALGSLSKFDSSLISPEFMNSFIPHINALKYRFQREEFTSACTGLRELNSQVVRQDFLQAFFDKAPLGLFNDQISVVLNSFRNLDKSSLTPEIINRVPQFTRNNLTSGLILRGFYGFQDLEDSPQVRAFVNQGIKMIKSSRDRIHPSDLSQAIIGLSHFPDIAIDLYRGIMGSGRLVTHFREEYIDLRQAMTRFNYRQGYKALVFERKDQDRFMQVLGVKQAHPLPYPRSARDMIQEIRKALGPRDYLCFNHFDHLGFEYDLYCPTKKIIIELDGPYHFGTKTKLDKERDEILASCGLRTFRINLLAGTEEQARQVEVIKAALQSA